MSPQEYTSYTRTILFSFVFICALVSVLMIFSGFFGKIGTAVEYKANALNCAEYSMMPHDKLPISCYDYFGFSKK